MSDRLIPAPWCHIVGSIRLENPDTLEEYHAALDILVSPDRHHLDLDASMFGNFDHSSLMTSDDPAVVKAIAGLFDSIFVINASYREAGRLAIDEAAD